MARQLGTPSTTFLWIYMYPKSTQHGFHTSPPSTVLPRYQFSRPENQKTVQVGLPGQLTSGDGTLAMGCPSLSVSPVSVTQTAVLGQPYVPVLRGQNRFQTQCGSVRQQGNRFLAASALCRLIPRLYWLWLWEDSWLPQDSGTARTGAGAILGWLLDSISTTF